jgi:hypothetical protein
MRALGFDNYEGVLKIYLAKYREVGYLLSLTHTLSMAIYICIIIARGMC